MRDGNLRMSSTDLPGSSPDHGPAALKPFGTRLDGELIRRLKLHSALTGRPVQSLVDQAIRQLLASARHQNGAP